MWFVQQNIDGHNTNTDGYVGMYSNPYGQKSIAQIWKEIDYDRNTEKKWQQLADRVARNNEKE